MKKRMEIIVHKLENKKKNMGIQDEFYLEEDLLFGYSQGQMAHTI
jgi:hypothetical protein